MVKAMLDIRTGMGRYIIDPAGAYGSCSEKLMPTYDPRDEARYLDFIRAYREWTPRGASTSKDTEVLEAGITGTVFAAYAYRAIGDEDGRRFAERLIRNNCDYMLDHMQNPDGSTRWDVNVFYMRNLGHYRDQVDDWRVPDTNQIGEWLRAISRAILYFRTIPRRRRMWTACTALR